MVQETSTTQVWKTSGRITGILGTKPENQPVIHLIQDKYKSRTYKQRKIKNNQCEFLVKEIHCEPPYSCYSFMTQIY